MKCAIIDIETVPGKQEILRELMPEEMRTDVMPEYIAMPDIPEPQDIKPPGNYKDREKIIAWQMEAYEKLIQKADDEKEAWKLGQIEKRQKFIDDAPLDARFCEIKLIGMRVIEKGSAVTVVYVNEESSANARMIMEEGYSGITIPVIRANEKAMLDAFIENLQVQVDAGVRVVGYNINSFDLPVIIRRGWVNGLYHFPKRLREGRYFKTIDLREEWQLGDRQAKSGGLDGLAQVLGAKRKTEDGANFWRIYRDSPAAAVHYLLADLDVTQDVARKMGFMLLLKCGSCCET